MGRLVKKASTDQSTTIRILDSTTFLPEEGVEHNTAGIALWYRREGETLTAITEVALAALDTAHTDGGIEHIDDGYYRLDPPDGAWAAGADYVEIGGTVTGMIVIGNTHALVDYDPYDSVRMGMTALPNAAADGAGGLPISDAGGLDMDIALKDGLFCSGTVCIDPAGTNSTTWPYGFSGYPTTTIANGKVIADGRSIDLFECHGDLTMSAAMEGYTFKGHGHMEIAKRINIDSQSVEHSVFQDLVIQGTMTNATGVLNTTRFVNCDLWALSDIHAIATDGALAGVLSIG